MIIVWFISFLMIFQLEASLIKGGKDRFELCPYHLLLNVFPPADQFFLYQLLENGQEERKRKAGPQGGPAAKKPKFQPISFIEQRCGRQYFESKKLEIGKLLLENNTSEMVKRILEIAIDYIMQDVRPMQSKSPSNQLIKITATTVICRSFENIPHHLLYAINNYDNTSLEGLIKLAVASKQKNKVK